MKKTNAILTWNKKSTSFEMVEYPLPSHVLDTENFCEAVNSVLASRYTDIATCEVARNKARVERAEKALTDAIAKWDYSHMDSRKEAMIIELEAWNQDIILLNQDIPVSDGDKKRNLEKRLGATESRVADLTEDLTKLASAKECADLEISSLKIKLENAKTALAAAENMLKQAEDLEFSDIPESKTLFGDNVPALYATLWVNVAGDDGTGKKCEPVSVKGVSALYRACTDFWNAYGDTTPDEKSGDKTVDWKRIRDDFQSIGARLNGPKNDGVRKMFSFTPNKQMVNELISFAGKTLKPDAKTGTIKPRQVSELEFQEQVLAHIFRCALKIDATAEKQVRREVV